MLLYTVTVCHTEKATPMIMHPYHARSRAIETASMAAAHLGHGGSVVVKDDSGVEHFRASFAA